MKTFDSYLNEKMKNPEFKAEYDALDPEFAIMQALIDARKLAKNGEEVYRIEPLR